MLGKPFAVTDEGVNVIEEGAIKDPAAVGLVRDDTERPVLACLDRGAWNESGCAPVLFRYPRLTPLD